MAKTSAFKPSRSTYVVNLPPPKPKTLLAWYDKHARDLPWREHHGRAASPYHTWISEIMLQQTGVATVIPYYLRFIKRWPNVKALAKAAEDDVLKEWAGLGYYSRARNLHACAKEIIAKHSGVFPDDVEALKKLPGIGQYTASALRAIAFDRPANVVDGNVERVMTRIFGYDKPLNIPQNKKDVHRLAAALVPSARNGDYAQSLMDLGATVCIPKNPRCGECPWRKNCSAFATHRTHVLPVVMPKKAVPVRYTAAFVLVDTQGRVFLRRRPAKGLLGGLWEVPTTEWRPDTPFGQKEFQALSFFDALKSRAVATKVMHVFSHFKLVTTVYVSRQSKTAKKLDAKGQWFPLDALPAVATLTEKMLKAAKELGEK